uniref:Uncharacterized protein n=1 Tax=Caenorhabditis japonica TaxID=281687 RepID=A0A8R1IF12_CAEJA
MPFQQTRQYFPKPNLQQQNLHQCQNSKMYFPTVEELLDTISTFFGDDPDQFSIFTPFKELVPLKNTAFSSEF